MQNYNRYINEAALWETIVEEAHSVITQFPILKDTYQKQILDHDCFSSALCFCIANKLASDNQIINEWFEFLKSLLEKNPQIEEGAKQDLLCQLQGNASIKDHHTPLLYFGGFHALQAYRFAHVLWNKDQQPVASFIQSQSVNQFGVDIHPAAQIGCGIFIDHAVGIVIGETAVVEDNVTLFQEVTLGGTGKGEGDRHPKVRQGAFIGAGAKIFGNIEIGKHAKVAGGAVIVKDVPEGATAVGGKAKIL